MKYADLGKSLRVGKLGQNLLQANPNYESYKATLCHPFDVYDVKVPTGYPVKSSVISKHNILSCSGGANGDGTYYVNIGGSVINTLPGTTPIAFAFLPTVYFDATTNLQYSINNSTSSYLFQTWTACMVSNSWSTNYSQYRVVSAGLRFRYTGAPLYAQGQTAVNVTNLTSTTSYSLGATSGLSTRFYQDPDVVVKGILEPVEITWTPADISCLEFMNISNDLSSQVDNDWLAWLLVDCPGAFTNGFQFYIETVINYEVIATATFDPISGGTESANGNPTEAIEAAKEAAKSKQKDWYPFYEYPKQSKMGNEHNTNPNYNIGTGTTPIPIPWLPYGPVAPYPAGAVPWYVMRSLM